MNDNFNNLHSTFVDKMRVQGKLLVSMSVLNASHIALKREFDDLKGLIDVEKELEKPIKDSSDSSRPNPIE